MTAEQMALLASISAFMSAVATFLTVLQLKRQRQAIYKPDLAFSRTYITGRADSGGASPVPTAWVETEHSTATEGAELPRIGFSVRLHNVGLGAAKDISIEWIFQLHPAIQVIQDLARLTSTPLTIDYDGKTLQYDGLGLSGFAMTANEEKLRMDYPLPASVDREGQRLRIPFTYTIVIYQSSGCSFGIAILRKALTMCALKWNSPWPSSSLASRRSEASLTSEKSGRTLVSKQLTLSTAHLNAALILSSIADPGQRSFSSSLLKGAS